MTADSPPLQTKSTRRTSIDAYKDPALSICSFHPGSANPRVSGSIEDFQVRGSHISFPQEGSFQRPSLQIIIACAYELTALSQTLQNLETATQQKINLPLSGILEPIFFAVSYHSLDPDFCIVTNIQHRYHAGRTRGQ